MEMEQENALDMEVDEPLLPGVNVRSGPVLARGTSHGRSSPTTTTTLEVTLPSLSTTISKAVLDGLQLWADDLAQWSERLAQGKLSPSGGSLNSSKTDSRAQSMMIGSRFFVERTASTTGEEDPRLSEFVVKINLNDGA
jgi:autophagy-related protein 2